MEAALSSGNASQVKKILSKDKKRKKILAETFAIYNNGTALHIACANKYMDIIGVLLKYKADINAQNSLKETPLHIACATGDPDLISAFLEFKPDVKMQTNSGDTALHLLAQQKHSFGKAIEYQHIFDILKQNGCDLVARNEAGNSPLHLACLYSAEKNVGWFLKEGVDIHLTNRQGESPLHLATRLGSKELKSTLISKGISLSPPGVRGTPRDSVRRGEIVKEMDDLRYRFTTDKIDPTSKIIIINGKELNLEKMEEMILRMKTVAEAVEEQVKEVAKHSSSVNRATELTKKSKKYRSIIEILEINCIPLGNESFDPKSLFDGTLLFKEKNSSDKLSTWTELYCRTEGNSIALYTALHRATKFHVRSISLHNDISFKVFLNDVTSKRRVTILFHDAGFTRGTLPGNSILLFIVFNPAIEEHYAVENTIQLIKCLKSWVSISCRPIEYIGDVQVMTRVNIALRRDSIAKRPVSRPRGHSPKKNGEKDNLAFSATLRLNITRTKSPLKRSNSSSAIHKILTNSAVLFPRRGSKEEAVEIETEMTVVNGTIRTTNFQTFLFGSLFSPRFKMDQDEESNTKHSYYMTSGTISDLLQFILIHSTPKLFGINNDGKAFYLSYYKHATPSEVLTLLEEVWNVHKKFPLPEPFNEYSAESRLYHFIYQFLSSPLVLMEFDKEIQFRSELVSFYGKHIPTPVNESYNIEKLKAMLQTIRKGQERRRTTSVGNLNSILHSAGNLNSILHSAGNLNSTLHSAGNSSSFQMLNLSPETVAAQIALINADLFRQMKVSELLDLRYQKNKEYATRTCQLHNFSNKIYFMVPSTILELDGEIEQLACLKAWISIAEKLFQYRDYNSCCQILNGVSQSSIMRLKHLKEGLTTKWVERFLKLRAAFEPKSNYKQYRQLIMDAPTIPFIGVALKDLTFAYDGNPDKLEGDGINFRKMRIISDILNSLHLGALEYYCDFSFLAYNAEITESILRYTPVTEDELYARSTVISNSKNASSEYCEDIPLLRKEIKNLHEEVNQLKEALQKSQAENQKKAARIVALKGEFSPNSPHLERVISPRRRKYLSKSSNRKKKSRSTEEASPVELVLS